MTPGFGEGLVIETRSLPNSLVTTLATFTLVTRTARACASYLAALPSTRAIETRSFPNSLAATHRGFAFYVAFPKSSIPDRHVFYVADPISSIRAVTTPKAFASRRAAVSSDAYAHSRAASKPGTIANNAS